MSGLLSLMMLMLPSMHVCVVLMQPQSDLTASCLTSVPV